MDVAMHRNGSDGNLSPVEEDEMHCSDGYNSEDEVASQPMAASQVTSGQFQDLFARLKAQQAVAAATVAAGDTKTELDEELDDLKQEERENRETNAVLLAMQRHAVQMAAAAAAGSAAGIPNFANLAALGGFGGQLNAMSLFANGAFAANANLSPPLGAVASQASSANQMTPSSCANGATPGNQATTLSSIEAGKGYTFEEQFKQLYEISEDPKRKQFLDELFMFMQKRGTPINRIPIMAKQVLDLYELYNLVVARGGLVEVINKKIWREITKGLNLPSSITSAAFTLRTQYMKYLYPYECEKENLSSTDELQMAIDGNRREGRRPSYGQYPEMGGSPPPVAAILGNGPNAHSAPGLGSMDLFGRAGLDLSSTLSLMSRQLNGVAQHHHQNNVAHSTSSGDEDRDCSISPPPSHTPHKNELRSPLQNENVKRFKKDESSPSSGFGFPGMNMKISSKDGRPLDGQITMSIEVNGVLYNGILFAQPQNSSQ